MVTIKFYADPTLPEFKESQHESVIHYLTENYVFRDQLIDLRFFRGEILGEEIDHCDDSFLDITDGIIAVTLNGMLPRTPDIWIYIAISVAFAAITVLLTPDVPEPDSSKQSSATNKLGKSSNEPRINQRIDDIFGTVTKHTPSLWQVPYRIGVDNQETEVLLLAIGRGKYLIEEDEIFDGDTRVVDIEGAKFSKYEPGTYPGGGIPGQSVDEPSLQIGSDIDEKIGIYRQSNDLNPSELVPLNDLENSGITWRITGSQFTALMEATSVPEGFVMTDYYKVGDDVTLTEINYLAPLANQILYNNVGSRSFPAFEMPVDLGANGTLLYRINAVTSNSITVVLPIGAGAEIYDAWEAMTNYVVLTLTYFVFYNPASLEFHTTDEAGITSFDWYVDSGLTQQVFIIKQDKPQFVNAPHSNELGPFVVPDNADEILLNFVSENGFYNIENGVTKYTSATINVVIYEIDSNGDETGSSQTTVVSYSSSLSKNRRDSIFKTERIGLPYALQKVSAQRVSVRDKTTGTTNVDTIKWRDLYSFEEVSDLDFGDVTLAHVVIPNNSDSQLIKDRRQNMNVTRLITEYQGNDTFGPAESFATDDFSQILIHTALDPRIGRLSFEDINADGFIALAEEIETYFGSSEMIRFGYDFDDSNVSFQDTFIQICDVVNCLPYAQSGVYDAFFEKLQPTSSMQVTIRNKIPGSESREQNFERQHNGVELTYRDEETSVSETIYVPADRTATNPKTKSLPGCVTKLQAFRYAARIFNKQVYSRTTVTFEVDEFGRNIIPGKRIDSPDSTRFTLRPGVTDGYQVYEGEVIETSGLNVELSEPIVFTEGEDHYIVFTKANGDNSAAILCTSVDDFTIALDSLPAEAIYDGYSSDRTKYTFSSEQLRESIALLPQTIEFSVSDDGSENNTVNSINYSAEYYADDQGTP